MLHLPSLFASRVFLFSPLQSLISSMGEFLEGIFRLNTEPSPLSTVIRPARFVSLCLVISSISSHHFHLQSSHVLPVSN